MKFWIVSSLFCCVFLSCRKKPFSWDAAYTAPIINDTLSLKNFVNDSTLSIDGNGLYAVNLKRDLFQLDLTEIVRIPDTALISDFTIAGNLSVPPGFSFVNTTEEHDLNLNPIELKRVILKEGNFEVEIENPYPTVVLFKLELPGVTRNGQAFIVQAEAPPGSLSNPSKIVKTVSMVGADMNLTGLNGDQNNFLLSKITVTTSPNGPTVQSTPNHVTRLKANLKDIRLDYARGYFGQQTIADTLVTDVSLLKQLKGGFIDFPATDITLTLTNGLKVSGQVQIDFIKGIKSDGSSLLLSNNQIGVQRNVNAAAGSYGNNTAFQLTYQFNDNNSNLEAFLEYGSQKLEIGYSFKINPNGNVSGSYDELFPNSRIGLNLELNLPLMIGLHNVQLADTFDVDLSGLSSQLKQVKGGSFGLELNNSFPISADLDLYFLDENNQVLFVLSDELKVASSNQGSPLSSGLMVSKSTCALRFSQEQISQLSFSKKIVLKANLITNNQSQTGVNQVAIAAGSFLSVKGVLDLIYTHELE